MHIQRSLQWKAYMSFKSYTFVIDRLSVCWSEPLIRCNESLEGITDTSVFNGLEIWLRNVVEIVTNRFSFVVIASVIGRQQSLTWGQPGGGLVRNKLAFSLPPISSRAICFSFCLPSDMSQSHCAEICTAPQLLLLLSTKSLLFHWEVCGGEYSEVFACVL